LIEGNSPQYNNQRGFDPRNKGNFGRGRGRGNFGRGGREPIICYNCNQPGYLACDYLNHYTTYKYCIALDHVTKYCPQLLAKWQEKGNQNQKKKKTIQTTSVKEHNERPRIIIVTCKGARKGVDVTNGGK
jgi:hypothetical protein